MMGAQDGNSGRRGVDRSGTGPGAGGDGRWRARHVAMNLKGQERAQIVLWAIAFPHQHLNSGSICITLHMREEHPRVGSAGRLRVAQTGFKSRSLEPSPDPFVLLQISHGPGGGVISCECLQLHTAKVHSPPPKAGSLPGMEGGVWCSLCLGCKILLGVSECAREPGDLSEDSREPPALSSLLGVELQQGGGGFV